MKTAICAFAALVVSSSLAVEPADAVESPQTSRGNSTVPGIRTESPVIGNREEPDEIQLLAFAKEFCAALRTVNNDDSKRHALSVFFDPGYLETHNLKQDPLPVSTVAVKSIFNIQIAGDRRTAVCEVETDEHPKELLLLRMAVHERRLYLAPAAPPDPTKHRFDPWIFRMELTSPLVGRWNVGRFELNRLAGRWSVEFSNGVVETCEIRPRDWSASVVEPRRTSGGRVAVQESSVLIVYDDDRVERWTPVGQRMIVEHWYPAAGFRSVAPVPGIANRSP